MPIITTFSEAIDINFGTSDNGVRSLLQCIAEACGMSNLEVEIIEGGEVILREDKVLRQWKAYVQQLFNEIDKNNAGAIQKGDMKKIIVEAIPEYSDEECDPELEDMLSKHVTEEDTLDFPSVWTIFVHFLKIFEEEEEQEESNNV